MAALMSRFRAGDLVEVRSKEEIFATLDQNGELQNLPFMPEMLRFCGQRFEVFASAHKTCDTINQTGCRRMNRTVHLKELRCDGSAHGGCQTNCLFFWKDDWLRPAGGEMAEPMRSGSSQQAVDEQLLLDRTIKPGGDPSDPHYVCQATRLFDATEPLNRWSPQQYIDDISSGNVRVGEACKILALRMVYKLRNTGHGYRFFVRFYRVLHKLLRGSPSPHACGKIPLGEQTPHQELNLQVGEVVRVKPHEEILKTLSEGNLNRGMFYDKEMVRYCGGEHRVAARVTKAIDEPTGKLLTMATPSVILEGTYCTGQYSERRLMCMRRMVPFWREIWLERIESQETPSDAKDLKNSTAS